MATAATLHGPDLATRQPSFKLPPGACDCHAHVFGPFDQFPLPPNPTYKPPLAPLSEYVRMLRRIGCSNAVLVQPSSYGTDNSALVAALKSGEFSLRGIALIDDATTYHQMEEMHFAGVVGIRRHLMSDTAKQVLASLPELATRIKPFGWHLQFYLDATQHPDLEQHLAKLPVPVVIDHFGLVPAAAGINSPGFQTLLRCVRSGRCWVKLSAPCRVSAQGPRFTDVTPLARALLEAAPDYCLWGTDWPHPNVNFVSNEGDLVDLLPEWIPDETLRRKVLVENPARLYSF